MLAATAGCATAPSVEPSDLASDVDDVPGLSFRDVLFASEPSTTALGDAAKRHAVWAVAMEMRTEAGDWVTVAAFVDGSTGYQGATWESAYLGGSASPVREVIAGTALTAIDRATKHLDDYGADCDRGPPPVDTARVTAFTAAGLRCLPAVPLDSISPGDTGIHGQLWNVFALLKAEPSI